jgi:hypothetical protein
LRYELLSPSRFDLFVISPLLPFSDSPLPFNLAISFELPLFLASFYFELSAISFARPVKLLSKGSKKNLFHWGAFYALCLGPFLLQSLSVTPTKPFI